ncbi:MAG: HAD family hydrolase [Candidatus Desulfofervidaceae bacterium]|nr:HAD family hydrolase [Candidatus Desulfofervidaceae bacterium]
MMGLKAVIFDCDGVLFDSREANRAYYNALLEAVGLPPMTEDQVRFAHCHTVFEVINYLIPDPVLREKAYQVRKNIDYHRFLTYIKPEPYVKEVLADFKKQFKVGMATSRTNTIQRLLQTYGLLSYFDLVVSAMDVKHAKPHPESLFKIMTSFSVTSREMIYIGDAEVDAEMAKKAGVPFIAYKNPDLPADFYAENFLQLAEIIKG